MRKTATRGDGDLVGSLRQQVGRRRAGAIGGLALLCLVLAIGRAGFGGVTAQMGEGVASPAAGASPAAAASPRADTLQARVTTFTIASNAHTEQPVDYDPTPPVGGPHNPVPQTCGFYAAPVQNEHAVHSLEHGAVWITYDPDLPADQIAILRQLTADNAKLLVSPYPGLPSPVVASAWGVQLQLEDASDPLLAEFIATYRAGPQAPEPNAPCQGTTETAG